MLKDDVELKLYIMYRNIYCDPNTLQHKFGSFDFDTIEDAKFSGKKAACARLVKTVELPDYYPRVINLTRGTFCTKLHKINNYDFPCDLTR